jgi:hypothetical protein
MSWRDFLDLPIPFWWYELESRVKVQKKLREHAKKQTPGLGGFNQAEWEAARKAHKERVDA